MFRNYLKVAVRNLLKRKGYSVIKLLGLATGMAVCLLIVLFVQSELGYDQQHEKGDHVYRIALERRYPGRSTHYSFIPQSIGAAVQKEFPEVQECTRLFNFGGNGNFFLRIGDKLFEEKRVLAVDSNFFRVFSCQMIAGDSSTALMQPNSVVINETTAKRYFGSAATALGKQFETEDNDGTTSFMIKGVCKDWPANSHIQFDLLVTTSSFPFARQTNYINFSAYTYILLNPFVSPAGVESKFPEIIKKYVAGEIGRNFGQTFEQFQAEGNGYRYSLQPLKKIHLYSDMEGELSPNGSITAVYIFSVIALFILFLACINFINLSTARSVERAKEVGIRKTFGSDRRALIWQFLMESIVLSLLSAYVAVAMMLLCLPAFNQITGKDLQFTYFLQPQNISLVILFAFVVGIAAGVYPAFMLSAFSPILVLKGKFKSSKYGLTLRNALVVFQFAISVILIISTIIVNRQMDFMLSEKLGFKKDMVIIIERSDLLQKQTKAFYNELSKINGVEMVSGTSAMPGQQNFFGISYQLVGSKESLTGRGLIADEHYASLLGLQLKEGRFFSKDFPTDSLSVVLNEKALSGLGLKNAIGAKLTSLDGFLNAPDGTPYQYTVIGVVKDFHFQSLHQQVAPLFLNNVTKFGEVSPMTALRIKTGQLDKTVASIEKTWKKFIPQNPFHYNFLDQTLADQYHSEQTTRKVFTIFSSLAIFIACIGLLGLAAYSTQQRMKEISIRKVLGASVSNIVAMLSINFLKLVIVAALIAFPLAWFGMNKWLEDFAYRVNISGWTFLLAAVGATLIALITISLQAIKAAIASPAKTLRTE